MKKIISLCLALLLIVTAALTLIACDEQTNEENKKDPTIGGNASGDRIPLDYLPTDGLTAQPSTSLSGRPAVRPTSVCAGFPGKRAT